jgi:hypothetical protein
MLYKHTEEELAPVLAEVAQALNPEGRPWALLGGVASAVYGRPRLTKDIDVFCRPDDALSMLGALDRAGFTTDPLNPAWIYKAFREDVQVDVIFRAKGAFLDDDMISRLQLHRFQDVVVPVVPPEDLVVLKAIVHSEEAPRHWHDALGVLAVTDLDWEYFEERARLSPRRVLSLLLYAQSCDLVVPNRVVDRLFTSIRPSEDVDDEQR